MNIIAILIIAAFLVTSCNSQNNGERATGQTHEHVDGDGHDHENEPGHDHSKEDGHDHAGESTEKGHSDEIGFTREQAEAAGLETEIVKPSVPVPFHIAFPFCYSDQRADSSLAGR